MRWSWLAYRFLNTPVFFPIFFFFLEIDITFAPSLELSFELLLTFKNIAVSQHHRATALYGFLPSDLAWIVLKLIPTALDSTSPQVTPDDLLDLRQTIPDRSNIRKAHQSLLCPTLPACLLCFVASIFNVLLRCSSSMWLEFPISWRFVLNNSNSCSQNTFIPTERKIPYTNL